LHVDNAIYLQLCLVILLAIYNVCWTHSTDTYRIFITELVTHTTNGMIIKNCACKLANTACLIIAYIRLEQANATVIPIIIPFFRNYFTPHVRRHVCNIVDTMNIFTMFYLAIKYISLRQITCRIKNRNRIRNRIRNTFYAFNNGVYHENKGASSKRRFHDQCSIGKFVRNSRSELS